MKLKKNIENYILYAINRIKNELFKDPHSVIDINKSKELNIDMCLEYIDLLDRKLTPKINFPFTENKLINLAMIFPKLENEEDIQKTKKLYNEERNIYISNIDKYIEEMESARDNYIIHEEKEKKNNIVFYKDFIYYKGVSEELDKMLKSNNNDKNNLDKIDDMLNGILKIENRYISYIKNNVFVPDKLTYDNIPYNNLIKDLTNEWNNFKLFIHQSTKHSVLSHESDININNIMNILDDLIIDDKELKKSVVLLKKLLTESYKNTSNINKEEIKNILNDIHKNKSTIKKTDYNEIIEIVKNSKLTDDLKNSVVKYIHNHIEKENYIMRINDADIMYSVDNILDQDQEKKLLMETYKTEKENLEKNIINLENIKQQFNNLIEITDSKTYSEAEEKIKKLVEQISKVELDNEKKYKEIQNLDKIIQQLKIELNNTITKSENLIGMKEKEKEEILLEKKRLEKEISNLSNNILMLNEKNNEISRELDDKIEEFKNSKNSSQEDLKQIQELTAKVVDSELATGACKEQINNLTEKINDINNKTNNNLNEKIDQLENTLGDMKREKDSIEIELKNQIESSEKLKNDLLTIYGDLGFTNSSDQLIYLIKKYENEKTDKLNDLQYKIKNDENLLQHFNIDNLKQYLLDIVTTDKALNVHFQDIKETMCGLLKNKNIVTDICDDMIIDQENKDILGTVQKIKSLSEIVSSNLNQIYHNKDQSLQKVNIEMDKLLEEHNLAMSKLVTMTKKYEELNSEKQKFLEHHDTLEKKYKNNKALFETQINNLKSDNSALTKDVNILTNKIKDLEKDISKYNKDNESDKMLISEKNKNIMKLKEDITENDNKIKENNLKIIQLNSIIEEEKKEKLKLFTELKKKNDYISENKLKIEELTNKNNVIEKKLKSKDIDVKQLIENLKNVKNTNEKLLNQIDQMSKLNEELLNSKENITQEFNNQLNARNKLIKDLELTISDQTKQINTITQTTNDNFNNLNMELSKTKELYFNVMRDNRNMSHNLNLTTEKYKSEEVKNNELKKTINQLETLKVTLDKHKESLNKTVTELKKENEILKINTEQFNRLRKQNEQLLFERDQLKNSYQRMEGVSIENKKLLDELDNFYKTIEYEIKIKNTKDVSERLEFIKEQINSFSEQKQQYSKLVDAYERRIAVYAAQIGNFDNINKECQSLRTEYELLEKKYKNTISTMKKELKSCTDSLQVALEINAVSDKKYNNLKKDYIQLKKEIDTKKVIINNKVTEPIDRNYLRSKCEELLGKANETKMLLFGSDIEELTKKITEKLKVIKEYNDKNLTDKKSRLNLKKKIQQFIESGNSIDLKLLKLPKNCNDDEKKIIEHLRTIEVKYEKMSRSMNELDDLYSDIKNFGTIAVRLKPPTEGPYHYNTAKPVVSYKQNNNDRYNRFTVTMPGIEDFTIDKIYDETATNYEIFNSLESLLASVKNGSTLMILLYGQTGSGKTYTLTGGEKENGILKLIIDYYLKDHLGSADKILYKMYNLYKGTLHNLMGQNKQRRKTLLGPNEKYSGTNFVNSLKTVNAEPLIDIKSVLKNFKDGSIYRTTKLNENSSRAHMFIQLLFPKYDSSLILVDLCGNEKPSFISDDDTSQLWQESVQINLVLGEIINNFLHNYRKGLDWTPSGSLKTILNQFKNSNLKVTTIFHIHKYYSHKQNINELIKSTTKNTLTIANTLSVI